MKQVIKGLMDSPQRQNSQKLSNAVERLIVANELMRSDILDMKKALSTKTLRS